MQKSIQVCKGTSIYDVRDIFESSKEPDREIGAAVVAPAALGRGGVGRTSCLLDGGASGVTCLPGGFGGGAVLAGPAAGLVTPVDGPGGLISD